mmetsp:Transcript_21924/g.36239  ORF Transcript_21924/g.36239 Transcript_21924/m.36239 type:complete len:81 (-) Transcript_21924:758-1000(-)
MLTPEDDPSPTRPNSASADIPIFQVGFRDLAGTGDRSCGIQVVKDFVGFLNEKRDRKKRNNRNRKSSGRESWASTPMGWK